MAGASLASRVDCSIEKLFSELVCLKLLRSMDGPDSYVPRNDDFFGHDDDGYYSCGENGVERRLKHLESAQIRVTSMLEYIIGRLDAVMPPPPRGEQASAADVPIRADVLMHAVSAIPAAPSLFGSGPASPHGSGPASPVGSGPVSPHGYAFVCPLCLKPQHTPKAHCEHMRKAGSGEGNCIFDAHHNRHTEIIRVFGAPAPFVKWFVCVHSNTTSCNMACRYCSYLRAGTGRDYTDEDVRGHAQVQLLLHHVLSTGVVPGR